MAVGDVIFTAKLDTKAFKKDLKQLQKDGEALGEGFVNSVNKGFAKVDFGGFKDHMKTFRQGMKASSADIAKVAEKTAQLRAKYDELVDSAFKMRRAWAESDEFKNLVEEGQRLEETLKRIDATSGFGQKMSARLEEIKREMIEIGTHGPNEKSRQKWQALQDEIGETSAELLKADMQMKHFARGARLGKALNGIKGVFGKIKDALLGIGKGAKQVSDPVRAMTRRLLSLIGIGSLIRGAFRMMSDGMGNLVKADSQTKASVDMLKNALTALRNALASAFAPVLNTIAPIISKFIGMLVSAANAVASFISALLGKKFVVQASNVSSGLDGIGSSADGANASAKELQRTLMGFDKINKLDGDDSGGGGGGGAGGGGVGGGGFSLVPVSDEANEWADKFRESWENADFYWLGELLANKLNDALEKIPWDKIQDGARRLAGSLATFLNGFIENVDWNLVGETIAQGLNTAIYFAQTFVHTFNWSALGSAVANAINGFIENTDWSALGDTIGTAIIGAFDTLETFFRETDWSAIGSAIVETLASVDWVGIITGAVGLVGSIGEAIFELFKGAITTGKEKIKKWIESGKIWDDLFTVGSKVIEVGVTLFKKGWSTISDFVGAVVSVATSLVKSGWSTITSFVGDSVTASVSLAKKGWSSLSSWVGSSVSVGVSLVKKGWTTLSKWIGSTVTVGVKLAKHGWTSLSKWIGSLVKVGVKLFKRAMGGIYKNGRWSPVQAYASGGSPDGGQMFIARENGPELVGSLKGHTAVMNNDQIVASVSSGVAKAISGIRFKMNGAPRLASVSSPPSTQSAYDELKDDVKDSNDMMIILLRQILTAIDNKDMDVYLDGESIKRNTVNRINQHTRATGQLELII